VCDIEVKVKRPVGSPSNRQNRLANGQGLRSSEPDVGRREAGVKTRRRRKRTTALRLVLVNLNFTEFLLDINRMM